MSNSAWLLVGIVLWAIVHLVGIGFLIGPFPKISLGGHVGVLGVTVVVMAGLVFLVGLGMWLRWLVCG